MWEDIVVMRACHVVPDEIINYYGMQWRAEENDKSYGNKKKTGIFLCYPTPFSSLPRGRSWKQTGDRNARSQHSQLTLAGPPLQLQPGLVPPPLLRGPCLLQCGFSPHRLRWRPLLTTISQSQARSFCPLILPTLLCLHHLP